jgi:hypothetical protein
MLREPGRADGAVVPAARLASQEDEHDNHQEYRSCADRDPNHRYLAVIPYTPRDVLPARSLTEIHLQKQWRTGPLVWALRHALARVGEWRRGDVYRPGHLKRRGVIRSGPGDSGRLAPAAGAGRQYNARVGPFERSPAHPGA